MKKIFISTMLLVFCSTMVFANKIDGKWKGTYETDYGEADITIVYKVDGDKLTGKVLGEDGDIEIKNGTVKSDEFQYTLNWEGYTLTHKGKLAGDEIKIKWEVEGYEGDFTVKRVKN